MKKTFKYWASLVLTVVLAIVFVVLKLAGVIAWSWWWVFSPILIPFAAAILLLIVALIFAAYYSKELKKTK